MSFVRPKELDCFYPWHVTRSCPIKRRRLSWEVPHGTEFLRVLKFLRFLLRIAIRKKKKKKKTLTQNKITANIFSAKIYSTVEITYKNTGLKKKML